MREERAVSSVSEFKIPHGVHSEYAESITSANSAEVKSDIFDVENVIAPSIGAENSVETKFEEVEKIPTQDVAKNNIEILTDEKKLEGIVYNTNRITEARKIAVLSSFVMPDNEFERAA